jgi:hypothetical protein
MNDQDILRRAEKRVDAKLGFYIHLGVYILVNGMMVAVNLMTSPGTYWFIWPLIGWGVGLLFHGLSVFVFGDGLAIRKKMIEAEMRRQAHKRD